MNARFVPDPTSTALDLWAVEAVDRELSQMQVLLSMLEEEIEHGLDAKDGDAASLVAERCSALQSAVDAKVSTIRQSLRTCTQVTLAGRAAV